MAKLLLHDPGSSKALPRIYRRAFSEATELFVVSAYLTDWDTTLKLNRGCRRLRIVVGSDFGITRKAACLTVLKWLPPDRCADFMVADGIAGFHPKAAFWRDQRGRHFALIGSSNLTAAAFHSNYEANVFVPLSKAAYVSAKLWLDTIVERSKPVSEAWLESYREAIPSSRTRKGTPGGQIRVPDLTVQLPTPSGMEEAIEERRSQLAAHRKRRAGLMRLFRQCAAKEISSRQFFEDLPMYWSSDAGNRLQGKGWERQGKASDFERLASSLTAIVDAPLSDRDDVVQEQIDWLARLKIPSRGAFLSEMLCLRFPERYPVLNKPVWQFLKDVGCTARRGAKEGARYIYLARILRSSLRESPKHPAKNLAELDTVIWLKYRFGEA